MDGQFDRPSLRAPQSFSDHELAITKQAAPHLAIYLVAISSGSDCKLAMESFSDQLPQKKKR